MFFVLFFLKVTKYLKGSTKVIFKKKYFSKFYLIIFAPSSGQYKKGIRPFSKGFAPPHVRYVKTIKASQASWETLGSIKSFLLELAQLIMVWLNFLGLVFVGLPSSLFFKYQANKEWFCLNKLLKLEILMAFYTIFQN
jgi:hypothetical protein